MLKPILTATALAALLASPAFAQSSAPATPPAMPDKPAASAPAPGGTAQSNLPASGKFVQQQASGEWRASKLLGANVYGPDNTKIGDINDVVLGRDGMSRAVVIGVGGFLGVGGKPVAISFADLTITPTAAGDSIEKITVSYSKDQLAQAPEFKYIVAETRMPSDRRTENRPATMPPATGVTR